jgi:DGQHR domain-containing protein
VKTSRRKRQTTTQSAQKKTTRNPLAAKKRRPRTSANRKKNYLEFHALEVTQGKKRVYEFAVDGKIVEQFTEVSRIRRNADGHLQGYQRPEASKHIQEIRDYIDTPDAIIPNAPVIGFDKRVTFTPIMDVPKIHPYVQVGILKIPLPNQKSNQPKPGKIVDGQQRLAAIRDATRTAFPISVVAFIADDEREFSTNFIRVNNVKPLKTTLETELITTIKDAGTLPERLAKKHAPSLLVERLALDPRSPLNGLITRETSPKKIITEQSMIEMIANSLSDGLLFDIQSKEALTYEQIEEQMFCLLRDYWRAIEKTFPEAWAIPPKQSRLMHGTGIVSMGFLMEEIAARELGALLESLADHLPDSEDATSYRTGMFCRNLEIIAPACQWTSGSWDFGDDNGGITAWNEIENTPAWKKRLTKHLKRLYKKQRGRTRRVNEFSHPLPFGV